MGNIDTYVKDIGRKTFQEEPFNDVDNLVISYLVYYDFLDIVPIPAEKKDISVARAAALYRDLVGDTQVTVEPILLEDMGKSVRFRDVRLSDRVDIFSKAKTQFSALHVVLPDGTPYYVFRGIDYSVTGWMEAFQTSYMITPAQKMAAKYLQRLMAREKNPKEVLLGGHSKGGNLALYAAVHLEKEYRDRIRVIYQNDAPGLAPGSYDPKILSEFAGRVKRFSPQFLVIDSLFKKSFPNRIIRAEAKGFNQHEPFTWVVSGTDFVDAEADRLGLKVRAILDRWIASVNLEERKEFIRDFFGVWQAKTDAERNFDISKAGDVLQLAASAWVHASKPARKAMISLVKSVAATADAPLRHKEGI